jgi:hypothetical protein
MDTVLGLLGVLVWIVGVIALASAVTYVVVRLSPGDKMGSSASKPTPES